MVGFSKVKLKFKGLSFRNTYPGLGIWVSRRVLACYAGDPRLSLQHGKKIRKTLHNKVNNVDYGLFKCPGFKEAGVRADLYITG